MQKKPPVLLLAAILGVIAIGGTALLLMRGPGAAPAPPPASTEVAVAAQPTPAPEMRYIANRDIPPRTPVTSDMMRRSAVSGPMPAGAITSLDDVRGMITKEMIRSGDTVRRASFTDPLGRVIPANFTIPNGFRAVAIYVNPQQTAAGLVDVGDRIDVLVTQKLTIDKQPNQFVIGTNDFTTGRTIGTNLLVLAVEQSINSAAAAPAPTPEAEEAAKPAGTNSVEVGPNSGAAPPAPAPAPVEAAPAPNAQSNGGQEPSAAATGDIRVILAAPLETASRLVAANASGTLHVVIRNPLDGDAERGPEVREYPSRTITVAAPKPQNGGGGGGGGGGNGGGSGGGGNPNFSVPDLPPVTITNSPSTETAPAPMPMSMPAMSAAPAPLNPETTAPQGPETSDIMVVRGTEKTRVIVPKR